MSQLHQLSEPFPPHLVKKPPEGKFGDYVPHSAVTERLLAVIGPYSTFLNEIVYAPDGKTIEGVVLSLSADIDGNIVEVTEVGDCENPGGRKNNGALLKDAMSDAIKRCAMRLGLGLHLWSQGDYFLYDYLGDTDDAV